MGLECDFRIKYPRNRHLRSPKGHVILDQHNNLCRFSHLRPFSTDEIEQKYSNVFNIFGTKIGHVCHYLL